MSRTRPNDAHDLSVGVDLVGAIPAEYARSRHRSPEGILFRDLNGNGAMDDYENPTLPIAARVDDLLARLSVEEKAGLLFQEIVPSGPSDTVPEAEISARADRNVDLVITRLVNHVNLHAMASPRRTARWHNHLQALVETTPHGIPVTVSSDPRHGFTQNPGASFSSSYLSTWPEPLGLAALRDPDVVRRFADISRREYLALGIRTALHPSIDLATEPRWARQYATFGQDAQLTSQLAIAYIDGFEGPHLGPTSVACIAKHFPGGGPQAFGEDPHFPYGREQVYPGDRFEEHLQPFRAVIDRGVTALMPYYGMPVGLRRNGEEIESVGFGFNRQIITGLLREELGFDGVVCSDWGLVHQTALRGRVLPPRSWGVEHLDTASRVLKILDAGCDQLGGESCPEVIVQLVRDGRLAQARLDEAARRLLRVKFSLGLFDNPYVDEDLAAASVGQPDDVDLGCRTQSAAVTVLLDRAAPTNHTQKLAVLPLGMGQSLYLDGVATDAAAPFGKVVENPADADLAIVRLTAPFEPRDRYFLEAQFHAGSLEFDPTQVARLAALAERTPLVVAVTMDRPAILTPLLEHCSALVAEFGASDTALLAALFGVEPPHGRLPFELPRSQAAVESSRSDVPGDTLDPLFEAGFGLVLEESRTHPFGGRHMSTTEPISFTLDALPDRASTRSVTATPAEIDGRTALRVSLTEEISRDGQMGVDYGDQPTFVIIPAEFTTGVIEVDIFSRLVPGAPDLARGFAGIAYHLVDDGDRFESVYLRPTNGRKHNPPSPRDKRAIQYFAYPEWPYDRLREVYPDGRYENGADIGLGEWMHLRLDIESAKVAAAVNGEQVLVVTELKSVPVAGALGLFVDIGTEAFFANLTVNPTA